MKKTRFLVLSLAVAIMLMGAGYAYWTETLTISNTVTTGALELDFFVEEDHEFEVDTYMDSDDSFCQVKEGDNNVLEVRLAKMYPGAEATFEFGLKNAGTMQAKVKNFDFHPDLPGEYEHFIVKYFAVDGGSNLVGENGVKLSELENELSDEVISIDPDASKIFKVILEIDPEAGDNDVRENAGEGNVPAFTFSLTADGLQWNDEQN